MPGFTPVAFDVERGAPGVVIVFGENSWPARRKPTCPCSTRTSCRSTPATTPRGACAGPDGALADRPACDPLTVEEFPQAARHFPIIFASGDNPFRWR
jgi:hypothetical protein